jgi:hypothetical protein
MAFLFGIAFTALVSFKMTDPVMTEVKSSTADVEQMGGLHVFIHSKPMKKYETIGSISPVAVWSDAADKMIDFMIKKGKKDYPTANGIIFTKDDMSKADLIKLAE